MIRPRGERAGEVAGECVMTVAAKNGVGPALEEYGRGPSGAAIGARAAETGDAGKGLHRVSDRAPRTRHVQEEFWFERSLRGMGN